MVFYFYYLIIWLVAWMKTSQLNDIVRRSHPMEMTYLLSKIPLRFPVIILNMPRRSSTMHAAMTMMMEG